jgi:hypothetical protein
MRLPTTADKPNVLLRVVGALRFDVFGNAEMASTFWPNLYRLAQFGSLTALTTNAPAIRLVCPAIFPMPPLHASGVADVVSKSAGRSYCDVERDDLAADPKEHDNLINDAAMDATIADLVSQLAILRAEIFRLRGVDPMNLIDHAERLAE